MNEWLSEFPTQLGGVHHRLAGDAHTGGRYRRFGVCSQMV